MQTFLPVTDFKVTAALLDTKRLGKQRVECLQILQCLTAGTGEWSETEGYKIRTGWKNHPAVRMWCNFEPCLAEYAIAMCREWKDRGYKDNMEPRFARFLRGKRIFEPPFVTMPRFLDAHKASLFRKDPYHYLQFAGVQANTCCPWCLYYWPTHDTGYVNATLDPKERPVFISGARND